MQENYEHIYSLIQKNVQNINDIFKTYKTILHAV